MEGDGYGPQGSTSDTGELGDGSVSRRRGGKKEEGNVDENEKGARE
jgi:hypothetical protein